MVRILFAFLLFILGAIGVITPLIPGWPLMVVGLSMLAAEYVWARRLLMRLRRSKTGKRGLALFGRRRRPGRPSPGSDVDPPPPA